MALSATRRTPATLEDAARVACAFLPRGLPPWSRNQSWRPAVVHVHAIACGALPQRTACCCLPCLPAPTIVTTPPGPPRRPGHRPFTPHHHATRHHTTWGHSAAPPSPASSSRPPLPLGSPRHEHMRAFAASASVSLGCPAASRLSSPRCPAASRLSSPRRPVRVRRGGRPRRAPCTSARPIRRGARSRVRSA